MRRYTIKDYSMDTKIKVQKVLRILPGKRHAIVLAVTREGKEIQVRKPISAIPAELIKDGADNR
jgi:hypothetical protein